MAKIPEIVKNKAKELIDIYGNRLKYIGDYINLTMYMFCMPKYIDTGGLFIYIYKDNNVENITDLRHYK